MFTAEFRGAKFGIDPHHGVPQPLDENSQRLAWQSLNDVVGAAGALDVDEYTIGALAPKARQETRQRVLGLTEEGSSGASA